MVLALKGLTLRLDIMELKQQCKNWFDGNEADVNARPTERPGCLWTEGMIIHIVLTICSSLR